MKYGELNLGQIEAIVNKLGGMEGVLRFLAGAGLPKIAPRDLMTITLGTYKNVNSLKTALAEAGFRVGDWANDIMSKSAFTLACEETTIELVSATVAELGFTGNTRYDAICARIQELGYKLCPAEVGPQLRLQRKDQPHGEWLVVAMEAIAVSGGGLVVFSVARVGSGLWLVSSYDEPDSIFSPDFRFVFVRRK